MTHDDPLGGRQPPADPLPDTIRAHDDTESRDLHVLVTGGTSGIGKATAMRLAGRAASLHLVGRDQNKGRLAAEEVASVHGHAHVTFLPADMSLMWEIPRLAELVRQRMHCVDVLVHAAGGSFPYHRTVTAEGLEQSFAIQYLARFALTNELLLLLRAAQAPKVISIAGGGAGTRRIDHGNLQGERRYGLFGAIARAAAANDLLTKEQLVRMAPIRFYNYGPGLVRTATSMPNVVMRILLNTVGRPFSRSPDQAARDIERLVVSDLAPGFYGPGLKPRSLARYRFGPSDGARLWAFSDQLLRRLVGHASPSGV